MHTSETRGASKPHIMIATPCFGGMVTQQYMRSTYALMQLGNAAGWTIGIELLGYESLITRGRNTLVTRFLDTPEATHLLFIDADIGFEVEQVLRMVALGEDVVAGMYPLKLIDWNPGAVARVCGGEQLETAPMRYVGAPHEEAERQERDGFVSGIYAGTGFMMIRRGAIMRLIEANPQLRFRGTHNGAAPPRNRDEYALFECMIDPDTGVYLSEDYAFCRRWRDIGGQVWLDTRGSLTHVGAHDFQGRPHLRFGERGAQAPAFAAAAE